MKEIKHLSCTVHESLRSSTFLFDLPRVVEELVHNSLDASSTKVAVSLGVGSCYVKVEDDGCGITRDGLVILGERYATSKVHQVNDVGTFTERLGFKGEALSSVSDISLVEIRSKARGRPNAYCKIIKNSMCIFFGIDDQREDVGTTVIVRDLFYNQPIRRKFMQSSLRKELHCVKKCVLRIALVHPQVSFKVIDTESDHMLLCTVPSLSSLPLVTDGFGCEVSSSLREIEYSDQELTLSGFVSGPKDAFSTKVFQYIYINSRFICKSPIHNLINSLATSFQCTMAKWGVNSEHQGKKRQKTQGYPAYLLNLSCPMSSYDLSFEPSKTRVEFKDWASILLFFEQSIMTLWKQFASNLFQGAGSTHAASYHESGTQREDFFREGITNSSKFRAMEGGVHFHQGSISNSRVTNSLGTFSGDANNCKEHNRSIDDEDHFSLPKKCYNKDYHVEFVNSFPHHVVNSVQGASTSRKQSRYMDGERYELCGIVDDISPLPLTSDSAPSKIYPVIGNERISSPSCSTSCIFSENHNFLNTAFSDKDECAAGANRYNECLHISDNLIFKMNMDNTLYQEKMSSQQPVIGVIRKCRKLAQEDAPIFKGNPFFHDRACLTEENGLGHCKVAEYVDGSRSGSPLHYDFADPLIGRAPPRLQDIVLDSSLVKNHVYVHGADYKHYAIEEKNAEFFNAILNESCEGLPTLNCIGNTALDYKFCTSSLENLQNPGPLDQFVSQESTSTSVVNEEKGFLSEKVEHSENCNSSFLKFAKQNHVYDDESSSKNDELQNSSSDVLVLRLRRGLSAPPFYEGKKKIPVLNHLPTDYDRENSTTKSTKDSYVPGLSSLLEPFSTSQRCMKPFTNFSQPCSSEFNYGKSNHISMIEMQACEGFNSGSASDEIDPASDLPTKWRSGILQPVLYQDGGIAHEVDVLDISSGLLHLSCNSLVPASINKACFENAKVLQQLDRKFIPAIANGTLVIIDQHAADERIRLEGLRKKVLHGELCSSTHLNPEHELILPEMGYQLLHKYEEQIKKWGWIYNIYSQHSESFERSMDLLRPHRCRATLIAVPHILGIDLMGKELLEYIDQLVETDGSSVIPPAVIRILNYKACRGAIMFGDALLPSECSLIVQELRATSLCFQCAHGRPTTVPLLNMAALHEQLARMAGRPDEWHGLRRHTPSIRRARRRLELC